MSILWKQHPLGAGYFGEIRDKDDTFVVGQSSLGRSGRPSCVKRFL
jgi:hypothetical protein